jgi:hypothetical protein
LSCLVLSCLVLSCLVLSCLVLSCLVLSCLVLSCLVSFEQMTSDILMPPTTLSRFRKIMRPRPSLNFKTSWACPQDQIQGPQLLQVLVTAELQLDPRRELQITAVQSVIVILSIEKRIYALSLIRWVWWQKTKCGKTLGREIAVLVKIWWKHTPSRITFLWCVFSKPCTKLTLHFNHRSGHFKTEHTESLFLLRRHLGNWPRSKNEKRTAGSAWETWTVTAADCVRWTRVRWEINFLSTFETAPFLCVYTLYYCF